MKVKCLFICLFWLNAIINKSCKFNELQSPELSQEKAFYNTPRLLANPSDSVSCSSKFIDNSDAIFYARVTDNNIVIPLIEVIQPKSTTNLSIRMESKSITHGTLLVNNSENNGNNYQLFPITYTPLINTYGTDSFTYQLRLSTQGNPTSLCTYLIRVCYLSCESCNDPTASSPTNDTNHNCIPLKCASGYAPLNSKQTNCLLINTTHDGLYYDQTQNKFFDCDVSCKTCSIKGAAVIATCDLCNNTGDYFIKEDVEHICYLHSDYPDYYIDSSGAVPVLRKEICYSSCQTCSGKGNETDHLCIECETGYHYFEDEKETNCYSKTTDGYYYVLDENKYYFCYGSCKTCTVKEEEIFSSIGNILLHHCDSCIDDYYQYEKEDIHSCYEAGKEGYYKDPSLDIYNLCYETCKSCTEKGISGDHNCLTCKLDHSFYEGKDKNWDNNKTEDNTGFYYQPDDNTYYKCYSACESCIKAGDASNHNCLTCNPDRSFFQNLTENNCEKSDGEMEGYFYIEEENTYYNCNPTCKYCHSNITQTKAHNCKECIDNYYFIYGTTYCIEKDKSDSVFNLDDYYFDTIDKSYKECYETCDTCLQAGTPTAHNCLTCKTTKAFIETEIEERNCIPNVTYPQFYYQLSNNTYMKCYHTCDTCTQAGNASTHNCVSCINGLIFDMFITNNCVKQCDKYWQLTAFDHHICVDECEDDFPDLIPALSQCVSECPALFPFFHNGECIADCPSGTVPYNKRCFGSCFPDSSSPLAFLYIDHYLNECIREINATIIEYLSLRKPIAGKNFALQVYSFSSQADVFPNISSLNFTQCEDILIKMNIIQSGQQLIIAKYDIIRSKDFAITNKVEYSAYDTQGRYIDLSRCSLDTINVAYSTHSFNLTILKEGELFYIDKSIDLFNPNHVFFNDICFHFEDNNRDIHLFERRRSYFRNHSFCEENCSYQYIDYNQSKAICNCLTKPAINTSADVMNQILLFTKDIPATNYEIVRCYHLLLMWNVIKPNGAFWLNIILVLVNAIMVIAYSAKGIKHLFPNIYKNHMEDFNYNDYLKNNHLAYYISKYEGCPNSKLNMFNSPDYETVRTQIVLFKKHKNQLSQYQLMQLPYCFALTNDNRSMWRMFYDILLQKIIILRVFLPVSLFEIVYVKLSNCIVNICFILLLLSLLMTDTFIFNHDNHNETDFNYYYLITNVIITGVLSFLFNKMTTHCITVYHLFEEILHDRQDKKTLMKTIKSVLRQFSCRLWVYNALSFTICGFSLYYSTIFCAIYSHSQEAWLIGAFACIGLCFVLRVVMCFGISLLRYYSLVNQSKTAFSTSIYLYHYIL